MNSHVAVNDLSKQLSCFHLNCRSLVSKATDIQIFLQLISFSFDIIAFTETESSANVFSNLFEGYTLRKQINVYHANCHPRPYLPKGRVDLVAPSECINVLYYDSVSSNNGKYMALTASPGARINAADNLLK